MPKGQSKMVNPEKLVTEGTQDEDKQNKNTTQYVLNITALQKGTHTNLIENIFYKYIEIYGGKII